MYKGLSRLSEDYDRLLKEVHSILEGQTGHLSVGLLEGQLVDETLRDILNSFRTGYPGILVELNRYTFRTMLEALSEQSLDIGITLSVDVKNRADLDYLPLYALRNEMVLPSGHPLAKKEKLTLADFADEVFVEIEKEDSDIISELMEKSCQQAGFQPKLLKAQNLKSQIFYVESGIGIAAFNEYHQTCNHPGLVHIPLPELPMVEFCAAWQKPFLNPAAELFVSELQNI